MACAAAGCQRGEQSYKQDKPNAKNAQHIQQVKFEILTGKAKIIGGFIDERETKSYTRYQKERQPS